MTKTPISHAVNFLSGSVPSFDLITQTGGIERVHFKNKSTANAEELIRAAFQENPDRLFIQLRKKNGSSTKKDKMYEVINDTVATENNTEQQALNGATTEAPQAQFQQIKDTEKGKKAEDVTSIQNYIIRQLERELEEAKKKSEKLESQNEVLKKENQEISLELKTKDREFELAMRSKELEQKEEKNGTLGGVAETLMQNEMGQNLLIGLASRIMGVQGAEMTQAPSQVHSNQAPPQVEFEMQDEQKGTETTRFVAKRVQAWILEQEDIVAKGFFKLVQAISTNTKLLNQFLKQLQA